MEREYNNAQCALDFKNGFELLVAARLSAQCKDERVNLITKNLFKKFPDINSMANADIQEIENIIKPCGLFRIKSRNLKNIAIILKKEFDSKIPYGLENLQKLPGIGRKTANLIMSEIFGEPSIIVDTHVSRITKKLGLHDYKNIFKIEIELKKIIKNSKWSIFCHSLVYHGKNCCKARSPKCEICCIKKYCKFYLNKI